MNPDGNGSWSLQSGSIQPPDLAHDISGEAVGMLKRGARWPGLPVEPFSPLLPAPMPSVGLSLRWPWKLFGC